MLRGRLRFTIYIWLLLIVFIIGGAFLSVGGAKFRYNYDDGRNWGMYAVKLLASHRHDPEALAATRADMVASKVEVSLYAADGTLITSTVDPPLQIETTDRQTVSEVVEHGVVVARGVSSQPYISAKRGYVFWIGMVLVVVTLGIVIVRNVGVPLQRLAAAARRFGRGELDARANIKRNDEIGQVGLVFDQMADRVATLMAAQRELMANVSHELQTPIARIQVAIDLMVDGIDDRVMELLPMMSQDLRELERLIDDVMTLSRFELANVGERSVTPLQLEPVVVAEMLQSSVARFHSLHPDKPLRLECVDDLPTLVIDPTLVRRVIDNLIDNANKYSAAPTEIVVRATTREDRIAIAVIDRGIGITPEDQARLFTPFFRTDRSRSRKTGGIGLGLVLARRIIEAHAGTIQIESALDVGTTVTCLVPTAVGGAGS